MCLAGWHTEIGVSVEKLWETRNSLGLDFSALRELKLTLSLSLFCLSSEGCSISNNLRNVKRVVCLIFVHLRSSVDYLWLFVQFSVCLCLAIWWRLDGVARKQTNRMSVRNVVIK